jgi:hypothetical protein
MPEAKAVFLETRVDPLRDLMKMEELHALLRGLMEKTV